MIWDIFHQSIDAIQPIWEAGAALCLSSSPPPPLPCTFPGNSHDENTERGDLSMLQICWEASESEVQLHRRREGENMSQKFHWERKENQGLDNFLFLLTEEKNIPCHYFLAYEFLMLFVFPASLLDLFMQYANTRCYLWHGVHVNCVGTSLEVFFRQVTSK